MFKKSIYVLLVLMGLAACAKRENEPVQTTQVNMDAAIELVVTQHLKGLAKDFLTATQNLQQQTDVFCLQPSSTDLNRLQAQWKNIQARWFELSNYKFGPLEQDLVFPVYTFIDAYRFRGTDYLSSVRTQLKQDLTVIPPLTVSDIQNRTFQYLGLLPLEVLLFETLDNSLQSSDAIVLGYQQKPNQCELLMFLVQRLQSSASEIERAWFGQYQSTGHRFDDYLLNHLPEGEPPAITQILTAVQEHLDYLHKRHVVKFAGRLAGTGWSALAASVKDIQRLLEGDGRTRLTLFNLMREGGHTASVEAIQKDVMFALRSIEEHDEVNLELALINLDGHFKRTLPDALKINLGFNFLDGD